MAFLCIRKELVDKFKKALKGKEIDVFKLMQMTTEERTAFLEKFVGKENVKAVNTLFEEKLILKNKIQGLKNWASKVGELGRYDPAKKAKLDALLSEYKARQQERMFSPAEEEAFLADLVEEKFGTRITKQEAKTVFDLQTKSDALKEKFNGETWESPQARAEYGAAEVISQKYVEALKTGDLSVKDMIRQVARETKASWGENKPKTIRDLLGKSLKAIIDNSVSMVASFDNSFLGRQGLKTLMTHPKTWYNMAGNSFKDIWQTLRGKNAHDALMADKYSRPNYMNGEYEMAKILPRTEEQFPTSLPGRVPVAGRIYRAAENAFTGSGMRSRMDLYDLFKERGVKNGVTWDKKQIQDIGKLIGSMTARGQSKTLESSVIKSVLWAPKMLKANWDVLTMHNLGSGLETSFARKEAAKNLVKIVAETATFMMIVNAIKPGSIEFDPTSSNFGKIKIGGTTFDYTGGMGSLVTLAARIVTNSTKSSTTGVKKKLTSQFGDQDRFDVLISFLEGKTNPAAGAVIDWMKGQNFSGEKPTIFNTAASMYTPILLQNALQLKDDRSAEVVLGTILDGIGISSNTYQQSSNWDQSTGKELMQFQSVIGDEKFKEANKKFDQRYTDWLNEKQNDPEYSNLSTADKQSAITEEKAKLKDEIFTEYNFEYDKEKAVELKPLTFIQRVKQVIGIPVSREVYKDADVVMAKRMSLDESSKIKTGMMEEMGIPQSKRSNFKLDHTLPLELCDQGNVQCNAQSNLKIVPTDVWKSYTPAENKLARLYKEGKITLKQAQDMILDMKSGKKTVREVMGYNP